MWTSLQHCQHDYQALKTNVVDVGVVVMFRGPQRHSKGISIGKPWLSLHVGYTQEKLALPQSMHIVLAPPRITVLLASKRGRERSREKEKKEEEGRGMIWRNLSFFVAHPF